MTDTNEKIELIRDKNKSELISGVIRLPKGGFPKDLPFLEHESRSGELWLTMHSAKLSTNELAEICALLRAEQQRVEQGRAVFLKATSNLMLIDSKNDGNQDH